MIGMNIACLRRRNNLTQEQLAEKLHVSRQTLAKWERGESEPDVRSLVALSELFQVSLDNLVSYQSKDNDGSSARALAAGQALFLNRNLLDIVRQFFRRSRRLFGLSLRFGFRLQRFFLHDDTGLIRLFRRFLSLFRRLVLVQRRSVRFYRDIFFRIHGIRGYTA